MFSLFEICRTFKINSFLVENIRNFKIFIVLFNFYEFYKKTNYVKWEIFMQLRVSKLFEHSKALFFLFESLRSLVLFVPNQNVKFFYVRNFSNILKSILTCNKFKVIQNFYFPIIEIIRNSKISFFKKETPLFKSPATLVKYKQWQYNYAYQTIIKPSKKNTANKLIILTFCFPPLIISVTTK